MEMEYSGLRADRLMRDFISLTGLNGKRLRLKQDPRLARVTGSGELLRARIRCGHLALEEGQL